MLSTIRKMTKTWVSAILFGLIIISFSFFGLSNVSHWGLGDGDAVAEVGRARISSAEYADMFKRAMERITKQAGRPVTAQEAAQHGVDQQLLQQLVDETAALEMAKKLGLTSSDQQVAAELKGVPAFRDPIKEAFDAETYKRVLAENNLTPAYFEDRLRDDILRRQLLSAIAMGVRAPNAYNERRAAFMFESREADYIILDPRVTGAPPVPTDAELTAFLKENADRFQSPERRSLSYIRFRAADEMGAVSVSEDKLRELYDFRKDKLGTPEKRNLTVWLVKSEAEAATLTRRLRAGESAGAIAQSMGLAAPVRYDNAVQAQLADAKLAAAAFAAGANSVIGPVVGDLSISVVQVGAITPSKTVSFDEVKQTLREEMAKDMASDKLFETVQAFQDARDKGATLEEAAAQVKAKIESVKSVDSQGRLPDGKPAAVAADRPELIAAGFAEAAKAESDIKDVKGGGEYFVVRVDGVEPSVLPKLDAVRAPLTQVWRSEKLRALLNARAAEAVKAIEGGKPLSAVARDLKLEVRHIGNLRRADAMGKPVPPLLENIFHGQKGDVVTGPAGGFAVGVAIVTAVTAPDMKAIESVKGMERNQLDFALAGDMGEQFMAAARTMLKVKLHPERAAKAIGVEPAKDAKPATKK
jgi:peptidyl-prolyl cis-trans isomerase D